MTGPSGPSDSRDSTGPGSSPAVPPAIPAAERPITIAIVAMGGEGGGVLADWLLDLAEQAGWHAQTTSVPGVAQRTGTTLYYLEMFPGEAPGAHGRAPVLALMPTAGEVDLAVASELMEAGRAVQRGLVTPERTTLVASTHRVYSMTEKMAMGDGRVDAGKLVAACRSAARECVLADFAALAQASGSLISAALFGAIAATGRLPFARDAFTAAITRGGVGVATSLAAFEAGYGRAAALRLDEAVSADPSAGPSPPGLPPDPPPDPPPGVGPALVDLVDEARRRLPAALLPTAIHSLRRLADYQDVAYAAEYLDRLRPFLGPSAPPIVAPASPAGADPGTGRPGDGGDQPDGWLEDLMRHLALWMSYEDTIRVADLKTRPSRLRRVADEVGLQAGQVLEIDEFLHPRVEEIADVLPASLGRRLLASAPARAMVARLAGSGRIVRTTSLRGYRPLFAVSRLRPWRRASLRHQRETAAIDHWLRTIAALRATDPALALEVIRNQRLVKGYSDTHARGLRHYQRLLQALPVLQQRAGAASMMRALREAALADESGAQLAALLAQLPAGAPGPAQASA